MEPARCEGGGKGKAELTRGTEAEAAKIVSVSDCHDCIMAENARVGEALFYQLAADAKLAMRWVYCDRSEQKTRARARY